VWSDGGVTRRLAAAVCALLVVAAACSSSGDDAADTTSAPSTSTSSTVPTTTTAAPTTTAPVAWPAVSTAGPGAVVTPNGIVLAVRRDAGGGTFVATSPCGNEVTVTGTPITGATVVLDPGHGGGETGAVGPGGTQEKTVNLAVAEAAKARLEALGATVVLTRTGDYRITLASRAAIAQALHPMLFVSVHHNAEPDGPRPAGPGSETYFQIGVDASHRAAGLVYEEVTKALSAYPVAWAGDTDAGAKYRPASDGGDYYGILRRTHGIPAVLSEAAFLTNPPEEAILRDPAVQRVEGDAIANAAVRFATTRDPGSGFVEPYPRTAPAGDGGGPNGCVDPALG
jgi:N-acetylmuramoyl-L-alanine amidase